MIGFPTILLSRDYHCYMLASRIRGHHRLSALVCKQQEIACPPNTNAFHESQVVHLVTDCIRQCIVVFFMRLGRDVFRLTVYPVSLVLCS